MEYTNIYALTEPNDISKIRYIGKSDNPDRRFFEHLKDNSDTYKTKWIKSILKNNQKPNIIILDNKIPINYWQSWEIYYIALYKELGFNLTNETDGGEGGDIISNHPNKEVFVKKAALLRVGNKSRTGQKRSKEELEKQSVSLKGVITWNKGLTKNTDERVKQMYDNINYKHSNSKEMIKKLTKINREINNRPEVKEKHRQNKILWWKNKKAQYGKPYSLFE